jgi:hypothetical protein
MAEVRRREVRRRWFLVGRSDGDVCPLAGQEISRRIGWPTNRVADEPSGDFARDRAAQFAFGDIMRRSIILRHAGRKNDQLLNL